MSETILKNDSYVEYRVPAYKELTVFYDQEASENNAGQEGQRVSIAIYLSEHSSFEMNALFSGTLNAKTTISVYMQGEHSRARVRGAAFLSGSQAAEIEVYQCHTVPHTQSDVMIKGLVGDSAQLSYRGLISIGTEAAHTDAVQENKNMLLGAKARASSMPSLEILTHEVRCGHGSAVGYLDDDQVWYLQSRGLSQEVARQLLIRAFVGGLFDDSVMAIAGERLERQLEVLGRCML